MKVIRAYLDPGSGSYFIQIIIGALLSGVYLTKGFWLNLLSRVTKPFKKLFKKKNNGGQS